jgi:uncharacterized protein YbaR (Trm112 family)
MIENDSLPFDADLFDLLVCPAAKVPLKWVKGRLVSTDSASRRSYRVDDGIPVMLPDEAQVLSEADWKACMAAPGPIGGGVAAVRARHAASPS